jgi:hypothetical protein
MVKFTYHASLLFEQFDKTEQVQITTHHKTKQYFCLIKII